ncbi:DUF6541 family protein [Microbacterium sp. Marseille-Q6965]|uniref:DUF6541 family protein n=1 Tax=Microbacterium sp. Marseille-Q6965 TaxID=2965072 RepID=UPI0028E0A338|nr:DUF6541 family protein [Microbacterium sp. Marseille-Q6965]
MWIAAVPAILVAVALVVVPGLAATAPLRLGVLARFALAGPASVCVMGLAAVVFGAAGLPYRAWQLLPVVALAAAVAFALRRHMRPVAAPLRRGALWALGGAWALSALAAAVVAFWRVPDPDRISQTYDNVFHLSAVAAILDGFSGSSLTLRSLNETASGGLAYYPAAWHDLVALTAQLSGASVPVAFNAAWLAVLAAVWLPGIAWLAHVLVPDRLAAVVAIPLGVSFGWFPYGLLTWGTIYPTAFAHALLPAAVAVTVIAVRAETAAPAAERVRTWLLGAGGVAIALAAVALAHPRVLPTWLLLVAPFVVWRLVAAFARAWRAGGRARRSAVALLGGVGGAALLAVAVAFAYAVVGLGLFDEPLENRLNGPQAQAVQSLGEGVLQVLLLRSMTGVDRIVTVVSPLLALSVIAGVIVAVRRPRARWIVVAYVLAAGLFVFAAGSDDVLTKLATGVWYKDRFRLAAALPVLAVPLATMGILAVARRAVPVRGVGARARAVVAIGASAVVALTATGTLAATGVTQSVGRVFHQPPSDADWEVVSTAQTAFMRHVVAKEVPADQRVLGDPWDGSALTQLFADREPVFPHVNGQWDPARLELAWRLDEVESNPAVCAALDELRVRHVLYNPHEFGGGDPAGNHFPGPHAAVEAGVLTPVASDGESVLYRIDQCGPLP